MEEGNWHIPGGHRRQAEKTLEHVRLQGVEADLSFAPDADLRGYDVVHMFTARRDYFENARRQNMPIAVSTIYWSSDYILNYHRLGTRWHYLKTESRSRLRAAMLAILHGNDGLKKIAGFWDKQAELAYAFRLADVVLPNAHAEGADLVRECGVLPVRVHFVPNAVETAVTAARPEPFIEKHGLKDFILCVGRGEPRKNQLRLIHALRNTRLHLVLVDPIHPHHADYRAQCRRAIGGAKNITCLESLSDDMLMSAYAAAKVHVLPSFYETTGLVTLEAALAGCNVVVNEQPHTREYFLDFAWYCDPASVASIRRAVEAAHAAPVNPAFKKRVLENFTWEHTARATIAAYEKIIRPANRPAPASARARGNSEPHEKPAVERLRV